jgi:Stage II sporulation protein
MSQPAVSSSEGKLPLQLSPGEYVFEFSASGYKPMRGHYTVTGSMSPLNVHLDPLVPPEALRETRVTGELRRGMELVHGFVTDGLTHRPIAGAQVKLQQSGAAATTNFRGYFQFMASAQPTSDLRSAKEFPPLDTLTVTAPGYETYTLTGVFHAPRSWRVVNIQLRPGTGVVYHDSTPVPLMPSESLPDLAAPQTNPIPRFLLEWLGGRTTPMRPEKQQSTTAIAPTAETITATAETIVLPSSITVGSNCATRYGCTTANMYTLEGYVQDGLDKEWISTWDPNSLEAGAVAYRSYGAWFVANPICPTTGSSCPVEYDICDNTYCQAFNTHGAKSTIAAAQATSGIVLSADGINVFFAEYALNGNALYCPDGQTGQPSFNWPCMLDPVLAGSIGSGHGRGMSQWGSQLWATGMSAEAGTTTKRDWRCILDHYYNANSNSITVDPTGTGSPGPGSGLRTSFMQGQPTYGLIAYEANNSRTGALTGIRGANAADGSSDYSIISGFAFDPSWQPGGAKLAYANAKE